MISVRRLSARVFGASLGKGGNPVTIYVSPPRETIAPVLQKKLAQACEWESVVVEPNHHFSFYMPSGEEVSFCAHAAMGAARSSIEKETVIEFQTKQLPPQTVKIDRTTGMVWLEFESVFDESVVRSQIALNRLLDQIQVDPSALVSKPVNASVARPKTLLELDSVEAVHAAKAPQDNDTFRDLCDEIKSTGLYLYAKEGGTLQARQFPRASGYPEDPATGIAAGALAVHLYQMEPSMPYQIFQGTAMGRPSLIQIDNIVLDNDGNNLKFSCGGLVEIDKEEVVELSLL